MRVRLDGIVVDDQEKALKIQENPGRWSLCLFLSGT